MYIYIYCLLVAEDDRQQDLLLRDCGRHLQRPAVQRWPKIRLERRHQLGAPAGA